MASELIAIRDALRAWLPTVTPAVAPTVTYREAPYHAPLAELDPGDDPALATRQFHIRLPGRAGRTWHSPCYSSHSQLLIELRYQTTFWLDENRILDLEEWARSDEERIGRQVEADAAAWVTSELEIVEPIDTGSLLPSQPQPGIWILSLPLTVQHRTGAPS